MCVFKWVQYVLSQCNKGMGTQVGQELLNQSCHLLVLFHLERKSLRSVLNQDLCNTHPQHSSPSLTVLILHRLCMFHNVCLMYYYPGRGNSSVWGVLLNGSCSYLEGPTSSFSRVFSVTEGIKHLDSGCCTDTGSIITFIVPCLVLQYKPELQLFAIVPHTSHECHLHWPSMPNSRLNVSGFLLPEKEETVKSTN